jgi:hypothetical protein
VLRAAQDQLTGKVYDNVEDLIADLNRDDAVAQTAASSRSQAPSSGGGRSH